jgi:uncharacterized membrane protein YesL
MIWSEAQKTAGRAEIQRRLKFETASTYRRSFFKAAGLGIAFLVLAVLGAQSFHPGSNWVVRYEGIVTFCLGVAGLIFAVTLSYVGYKNWLWRRRR